jgi:hypothetical protein
MDVRILDLDAGVARQPRLARAASDILSLKEWGPRLRLACGWGAFRRFEDALARAAGGPSDARPAVTFVGSGDFHHVSLALVRRQPRRCNLLVLDNHPDWMRGLPFLHCGTWLYHAARLPHVHRVFHVGGEVDFDNHYRWLAPWPLLRSGKIAVLPAARRFVRGWSAVPHTTLREREDEPATRERIEGLLAGWGGEIAALPLYVSLDRDVLRAEHAAVNWDSGLLVPEEVLAVVEAFVRASGGLAGMDVVGDWSPVRVAGLGRRLLHWTEHPSLRVEEALAQERNEALNLALLGRLRAA